MVTYEMHDQVAILRMDDGKANALNAASMTTLEDALTATASARALVLTGRPGFFSGGLDLKTLPTLPPPELEKALRQFFRVVQRIADTPMPVVAALSGHALAGGAVMTLASDYAISISGMPFKIGLNETAIGLPLPDVIVEMAKIKLSPTYFMRALAHGEIFSVEDAHKVGFIDELTDAADFEARAMAKATALAAIPTAAYLRTKQYLRKAVLECSTDDTVIPLMHHFQKKA